MHRNTKEPLPKASSIQESNGLDHPIVGNLSAAGRAPGSVCGNCSANPPREEEPSSMNSERSLGSTHLESLGMWPKVQQGKFSQRLVTRDLLEPCVFWGAGVEWRRTGGPSCLAV